jgi:hypothetical protein
MLDFPCFKVPIRFGFGSYPGGCSMHLDLEVDSKGNNASMFSRTVTGSPLK